MRHLITNIDTSIKDKELYVSFNIEGEWYPFMEVPFTSIVKTIGQITIFEIDILEGCYLEPHSFYKLGDKLPDGKTVFKENEFPKTWKITFDGTLEDLRHINKSKLLSFQTIYNVEVSEKNSKEPYVKVRTTNDNVYFTKIPTFKSLVGLNEDGFAILKGVFISPIMFKKGDSSEYNGRFTTITQDDKIVASFNLRIEGSLDNNYNLHGNVKMKNENNYSNQGYGGDDNDDNYRPSYEKYNGYNGFDDDTIDDAFEGDPDATWNVD
jgi:hypothetical protein